MNYDDGDLIGRANGGEPDAVSAELAGDDETSTEEAEAYDKQDTPPWTPVPLQVARDWLKDHEDGAFNTVFPTVYEEDRSTKLKDLGTAQALGVITHQRMSEQMAKELGIEQYDYQEELRQIEQEKATLPPDIVSATDELLIGRADSGAGIPPGAPEDGTPFGEEPPRRSELAGPATQDFRRDQRSMSSREAWAAWLAGPTREAASTREVAPAEKKVEAVMPAREVTVIQPAPAPPAPVVIEPKIEILQRTQPEPEAVEVFRRLSEAVDKLGAAVARGEGVPMQAARATAEVLLRLTEAVDRLGHVVTQQPEVHVAPPVVNVQPPVVKVEVKVPPAAAMVREVERDEETGLITRVTERPVEGG